MQSVYISTTYLGPVQQYCKLFQYPEIHLETAENYLKQTFREPLHHCCRQRSVSLVRPYRETGYIEVPGQGHPYLRSRELASPALERFGFGL